MDTENKILYQFKDFILDTERKSLWRDDELVPLTPKALETLIVLIKYRGAVVDKQTLLDSVWGDTFVEEATLAQNISILRKALGSKGDKQIIENIPRRGYRFVENVREMITDEDYFVVEKFKRTNLTITEQIDDSEISQTNGAQGGSKQEELTEPISWRKAGNVTSAQRKIGTKQMLALLGLVCVGIGSVFWLTKWAGQAKNESRKFSNVQFKKLFSGGDTVFTAISPDGNYLLLANREGSRWTLVLRQLNSEKSVEIYSTKDKEIIGISFSADNQDIFFSTYPIAIPESGFRTGSLSKIPKLGGLATEILKDIDSTPALSADRKYVSFVRNNFKEGKSRIILNDLQTGESRILSERNLNAVFNRTGGTWSPDGKTVVFAANSDIGGQMEILSIDVSTGTTKSLGSEDFEWIGKLAWINGSNEIIFPARSQKFSDKIWIVSHPGGEIRRIAKAVNSFYDISVTSDANSFVTIQSVPNTSFWTLDNHLTDKTPQKILQGFSEFTSFPQGMTLGNNNEIIFANNKNNNTDIWQMKQDGKELVQLTQESSTEYSPEITPDGKYIFYLSNKNGVSELWKMNVDGTEQKPMFKADLNLLPSLSTDGNYVYFAMRVDQNSFPNLWKMPVNGEKPIRLSEDTAYNPAISPDGKLIACYYSENKNPNNARLSLVSAETGVVVKRFDSSVNQRLFKMFWAKDGKSFYFIKSEGRISAIYKQAIESESPEKIVESQTEMIFRFALSRNDEYLIYESGNLLQDVVLVENIFPPLE